MFYRIADGLAVNDSGSFLPFDFQEVHAKHYQEFFKPNLELQGFKCVYKQRTGDEKHDGCAIFYHQDKFELKKTLPVDYNRGVEILDRDNIALLLMLQPKKVEHLLLLVVVHTDENALGKEKPQKIQQRHALPFPLGKRLVKQGDHLIPRCKGIAT
jgi:hypothetical protein